jgi:hypothetical protein
MVTVAHLPPSQLDSQNAHSWYLSLPWGTGVGSHVVCALYQGTYERTMGSEIQFTLSHLSDMRLYKGRISLYLLSLVPTRVKYAQKECLF